MTWTIVMNSKEPARKSEIERVLEKQSTQAIAANIINVSSRIGHFYLALDRI